MNKFIRYLKKSSWWLNILFLLFLGLFLLFYYLSKTKNGYDDVVIAFLVILIIFCVIFVIFSYINGFLIFFYDWRHKKINSGYFKIIVLILSFVLMSFSNLFFIYYIESKISNIKIEDESEYFKPCPF